MEFNVRCWELSTVMMCFHLKILWIIARRMGNAIIRLSFLDVLLILRSFANGLSLALIFSFLVNSVTKSFRLQNWSCAITASPIMLVCLTLTIECLFHLVFNWEYSYFWKLTHCYLISKPLSWAFSSTQHKTVRKIVPNIHSLWRNLPIPNA